MPYSEQFYIGGANSIRAFTIRSLGPGSYRRPRTTATATSTRRATSNWKPTSNTASASWSAQRSRLPRRRKHLAAEERPQTSRSRTQMERLPERHRAGNRLRTALRHQLPGHPRRPRHRPAHPLSEPGQEGLLQHFQFQGRSRIPPGHRVSVLNVRSGKAGRPPPYPRQRPPDAPPFGVRIRPFDPFRSAEIAAVTSRSQKSLSPFPAGHAASLPHLRHAPSSPDSGCSGRTVPSGHLAHTIPTIRSGTRRSARVIRPFRKHQMHGEETACSCHIIPNLYECNFRYKKTDPRVKVVVARTNSDLHFCSDYPFERTKTANMTTTPPETPNASVNTRSSSHPSSLFQ